MQKENHCVVCDEPIDELEIICEECATRHCISCDQPIDEVGNLCELCAEEAQNCILCDKSVENDGDRIYTKLGVGPICRVCLFDLVSTAIREVGTEEIIGDFEKEFFESIERQS